MLDFYGELDKLNGKPAGQDEHGNNMFLQVLPKPLIELNMEIAIYHPECQRLINEGLRADAYDIGTYFGIIFAYCGIALDSTNSEHGYQVLELCEQGLRALQNKRGEMAISINTIPSVQGLVQHVIDMKEDSKKIEILQ